MHGIRLTRRERQGETPDRNHCCLLMDALTSAQVRPSSGLASASSMRRLQFLLLSLSEIRVGLLSGNAIPDGLDNMNQLKLVQHTE